MSRRFRRVALGVSGAALLALASAGAFAAPQPYKLNITVDPIDLQCSGESQVCLPASKLIRFKAFDTTQKATIFFKSDAGHCSDVSFYFAVLEEEGNGSVREIERLKTPFLKPGENFAFDLPMRANFSPYSIGAEGRTGGCNTGALGSVRLNFEIRFEAPK